jgi:hypothetical protein
MIGRSAKSALPVCTDNRHIADFAAGPEQPVVCFPDCLFSRFLRR